MGIQTHEIASFFQNFLCFPVVASSSLLNDTAILMTFPSPCPGCCPFLSVSPFGCKVSCRPEDSKLCSSILLPFLFSESPFWDQCGPVSLECYNFWSTQEMFAAEEILLCVFNLSFLLQSRNNHLCLHSAELKGVYKKQVRPGSMQPCHPGSVAKECDALLCTSLGST